MVLTWVTTKRLRWTNFSNSTGEAVPTNLALTGKTVQLTERNLVKAAGVSIPTNLQGRFARGLSWQS